jgi:hypothetical protein
VRSAARFGERAEADLIEAGLNEGAGRLALIALWVLCSTALGRHRFDLAPCKASRTVLTGDWKEVGVRLRGERAGSAWDTGSDAVRARMVSTASDRRRDGIDAKQDC